MAEPALKSTTTESAAKAPASGKGDRLGLVLLLLVLLNVAGLAGLGYAVHQLWEGFHALKTAQTEVHKEEEPESSVGKELQPAKLGVLYGLEAFLVNIPADQGTKFLQLQMELELSDPALEDEINRKKAALRDAVIVSLSSKTFAQLRGAKAMKELQQDLLKAMNQLLSSGKIKEVYFTQFHFN